MKNKSIKITYINKKAIRRIINGTAITLCFYLATSIPTDFTKIDIDKNDNTIFQEYSFDTNDLADNELLQNYAKNLDYEEELNENTMKIISVIYKNQNLNNKERSSIYKLHPMWEDLDDFNIENACNNLSTLDIKYIDRPENYSDITHGIYNYKENEINIFENEEDVSNNTISHELVHVLFTNKNTKKLPSWFVEGVTQLLTIEYSKEESYIENNTYPYEVTMVKLLCEMVGSDKVIEAYMYGNMDLIYQELESMYRKDIIDNFKENIKIVFESFRNNKQIPVKNYNDMIIFINHHKMLSESQTTKETIEYYKNILCLINNKNPYKSYDDFINDNESVPKPYFSKELVKEYEKKENECLADKNDFSDIISNDEKMRESNNNGINKSFVYK